MVWVEFKPSSGPEFLWSAKCITNAKYIRNEGRRQSIIYGHCSPLFLSEEAPHFVCLFIFRHYFGTLAQIQSHLFTKVAKLCIPYRLTTCPNSSGKPLLTILDCLLQWFVHFLKINYLVTFSHTSSNTSQVTCESHNKHVKYTLTYS